MDLANIDLIQVCVVISDRSNMTQKNKDYDLTQFEESGKTQAPPLNPKKAGSTGMSVTKLGRLSLTTGLQIDMGINPKERDIITYVKVLQHKTTEGYDRYTFILQFFNEPDKQPYKLYKPKRKEKFDVSNDTSYFEFARFLKLKGIIDKVGDAKDKISPGTVDIIKRDTANRTLVINLKSRLRYQE